MQARAKRTEAKAGQDRDRASAADRGGRHSVNPILRQTFDFLGGVLEGGLEVETWAGAPFTLFLHEPPPGAGPDLIYRHAISGDPKELLQAVLESDFCG